MVVFGSSDRAGKPTHKLFCYFSPVAYPQRLSRWLRQTVFASA
jgi:hypothetical protein